MRTELVKLLRLVETGKRIRQYVEGISLVAGVIGSILILLVLSRKTMRSFPARVYFMCLAIFDMMALLAGIPFDLLGYTRSGFGNAYSVLTCQLSLFFLRGSSFVSLWTLAVLALDRMIAVTWPLRARQLCTLRRALLAELVIVLAGFGTFSHYFWSRGEQTVVGADGGNVTINCGWTSEAWEAFGTKEENIMGLVSVYFVTLLIIILNVVVIYNVRKSHHLSNSSASASRAHMMTVFMITTSVMIFFLTAPHLMTLTVMMLMLDVADQESQLMMAFAQHITITLVFVSQAANFYVYCLAGSRFREELRAMFGCGGEPNQAADLAVSGRSAAQAAPGGSTHKAQGVATTGSVFTSAASMPDGN